MPNKSKKLKGGASKVSRKINILVRNDTGKESYTPDPTDFDSLTLENLKFMSTHNSFIQPCQYGCEVRVKEVKEYLKYLKNFPICLEIDLMACKHNGKIQVFHFGKKSAKQYIPLDDIFNFILGEIEKLRRFFPLLLSIDTTQIDLGNKFSLLKKCPSGSKSIVKKEEILDLFKTEFKNYLHKKPGTDELETNLNITLPQLMNKVLIRFRHEGANIGRYFNETVQFKGKTIEEGKGKFLRVFPTGGSAIRAGIKGLQSAAPRKVIEDSNETKKFRVNRKDSESFNVEELEEYTGFNEEEYKGFNEEELREFEGFNKLYGFKDNEVPSLGAISSDTKSPTIEKQDKPLYKNLSVQMLNLHLFGDNNINCLAFNWQHLSSGKETSGNETLVTQLDVINAFTYLYQNFKILSDGGGKKRIAHRTRKKNKTRKKNRRKRKINSNKKSNLKKKQ